MIDIFIDKKKTLSVLFLLFAGYFYSQVRIANYTVILAAANSSAFIDASSSTSYNANANIGKGLLYPRTDLTTFTAFGIGTEAGIPSNYPSRYDGFMVYNTASSGVAGVGATEGTLCRGLWYYDNASNTINGGTWRPLRPGLCSTTIPPVVSSLNCTLGTISAPLTQGTNSTAIVTVPYDGGNGASYGSQTVSSTGVAGLTASLIPGTLANGSGTLTYRISGTPTSYGTASFPITVGGKTCTFTVPVKAAVAACGAYTAPGVFKAFMCHNLGANTSADPFTPSASIHGAKYQWGSNGSVEQQDNRWISQETDQANSGSIIGWNATALFDGIWNDASKTVNDPCPSGYRVPTAAQWKDMINNSSNVITALGPWTRVSNPTDYDSGLLIGSGLFLPSGGWRDRTTGFANYRGITGYYASSSLSTGSTVSSLRVTNSTISVVDNYRTTGVSVRCISE